MQQCHKYGGIVIPRPQILHLSPLCISHLKNYIDITYDIPPLLIVLVLCLPPPTSSYAIGTSIVLIGVHWSGFSLNLPNPNLQLLCLTEHRTNTEPAC